MFALTLNICTGTWHELAKLHIFKIELQNMEKTWLYNYGFEKFNISFTKPEGCAVKSLGHRLIMRLWSTMILHNDCPLLILCISANIPFPLHLLSSGGSGAVQQDSRLH